MGIGSGGKKLGSSSTWRLFKQAASDFVSSKTGKTISVCSVILVSGLVFGSNFIFHGDDQSSKTEMADDESNEPVASHDQNALSDSHKQSLGTRSIASVTGATHLNTESPSHDTSAPLQANSHPADPQSHAQAFNAPVNNPSAAKPQLLWNSVANPSGEKQPSASGTLGSTGSAQDPSGGYGAIGSNTAPAATPTTTVQSAVSSVSAFETNGNFGAAATTPSAGFAIVAGGSIGTGTGMRVDATIGQTTSPNVLSGSGLSMVSGLTGPVMVNF